MNTGSRRNLENGNGFDRSPRSWRRFPWRYEIKDYSPENLKQIFIYQIKQNDWDFEPDFDFSLLDPLFSQRDYFKNNGGDCLNLMSRARICHSRRVFGQPIHIKRLLNITDIRDAFDILKRHQQLNKKDSTPPYGMYL